MGCYGIGVTRVVAAAIEQNYDDRGIVWLIHLRTLRRVNGVALCLIDHYFADLALWPTLQRFDSGSPAMTTAI